MGDFPDGEVGLALPSKRCIPTREKVGDSLRNYPVPDDSSARMRWTRLETLFANRVSLLVGNDPGRPVDTVPNRLESRHDANHPVKFGSSDITCIPARKVRLCARNHVTTPAPQKIVLDFMFVNTYIYIYIYS